MTHEQVTELRNLLAKLVVNTGGSTVWVEYRPHVGAVVDYVARLLADKDRRIEELRKEVTDHMWADQERAINHYDDRYNWK